MRPLITARRQWRQSNIALLDRRSTKGFAGAWGVWLISQQYAECKKYVIREERCLEVAPTRSNYLFKVADPDVCTDLICDHRKSLRMIAVESVNMS